ncbi:hypothetical protein Cgig2_005053 [Carnegiea gigantea]|uniref:RNase H type-1 domain-containing protein n=1 Tax=Carnegiea gigantea TaxID=171969 RepID=A0A9Q1L267_9CARY|nr:hypothetical protein Cgig2_005053 [Carnegiea gigantea]
MSCGTCGHIEESASHAILECPLATGIWAASGVDQALWSWRFYCLADCISEAGKKLSADSFEEFLVVMWDVGTPTIVSCPQLPISIRKHLANGPLPMSIDFTVRDHVGNILLAGVKHTRGATATIIEEARPCLYALKCTYDHGFRSIIIEGDNLQLIQMLKSRSPTDSLISFFLKYVFTFLANFDFYSLSSPLFYQKNYACFHLGKKREKNYHK